MKLSECLLSITTEEPFHYIGLVAKCCDSFDGDTFIETPFPTPVNELFTSVRCNGTIVHTVEPSTAEQQRGGASEKREHTITK